MLVELPRPFLWVQVPLPLSSHHLTRSKRQQLLPTEPHNENIALSTFDVFIISNCDFRLCIICIIFCELHYYCYNMYSNCDRLWENQTIGAEFSIELQLNLCLQYKISNKMLLMYKYLQSFYYLSVKSDALNPTLSIETLRPKFRYYLIFPN